jgi:ADP-ribose pyrophosphatase YjhB (NUDIX family)/L-amino acid N-acyltransferase YncA
VGAGAVVELDGKLVLVRRGMNPMRGYWSLPSGYVERDEAPDQTAVRELEEETGLRVAIDNLLNVYSFSHEGTGGRGVLVLYAAHVVGGHLQAGDDADEVGTYGPQELPEDIAFDTHIQALRDWRRSKAIAYRLATTEEAGRVADLNAEYRVEIGRPLPTSEPGEGAVFVAVAKDEVVGYAYLAMQGTMQGWDKVANLDQIFVLPNYRRWGVATNLIAPAIALARQRGMCRVMTTVRATSPALVFYLKAGFRVVGFVGGADAPGEAEGDATLFLAYLLPDSV